jgi:hypothetical protein
MHARFVGCGWVPNAAIMSSETTRPIEGNSTMSTAPEAAARIATILTCPEAAEQAELAMHLATRTGMSTVQARSRLRGEPVSAAAVAALHAKPLPSAVFVTGEAPPAATPARMAAPAVAVTAGGPPVDLGALWDAALRARGMVLQGDAPKPSMMPATPIPPIPPQVDTPNPPDWGAVLRSRGMKVA